MKNNFNPIRGKRGEFRIAVNLSELGDRAWSILNFSQDLGFEKPKFETCVRASGAVEVWAILLQQFHPYEADTRFVVDVWDDKIDQLRSAIGEGHQFNLLMLCNFAEYLEPAEAC